MAACLRGLPMSQPDTGELTRKALYDNGIEVAEVERLADFDVASDVAVVRQACGPASCFARVTRDAGLYRRAARITARPATPTTNTVSPATADSHGNVATSTRHPARPHTLTAPRCRSVRAAALAIA